MPSREPIRGRESRARLGRDPLPELTALGQVRANPHLGPGADADRGRPRRSRRS